MTCQMQCYGKNKKKTNARLSSAEFDQRPIKLNSIGGAPIIIDKGLVTSLRNSR